MLGSSSFNLTDNNLRKVQNDFRFVIARRDCSLAHPDSRQVDYVRLSCKKVVGKIVCLLLSI